jgi:anti-sigma regulatory factor (Ser/Thr protein kinase)
MTGDFHIELRAQPMLLRPVRELLRTYLAAGDFPPDTIESVVLAVDEACTNAIRHSYGGSCDEALDLSIARTGDGGLEIVLCDRGAPAPAERLKPRTLLPPDPRRVRPGGLGVQFMFHVFDDVRFCPGRERGNRVVMRLSPHDPAAGGTEGGEPHGTDA